MTYTSAIPCHPSNSTPCSCCATTIASSTACSPTSTTSCSTSSTRSYATIKLVHLKPEFAGIPDEDVEAHLLRTNDWMDTHAFPEGVKAQRFYLILEGERYEILGNNYFM